MDRMRGPFTICANIMLSTARLLNQNLNQKAKDQKILERIAFECTRYYLVLVAASIYPFGKGSE